MKRLLVTLILLTLVACTASPGTGSPSNPNPPGGSPGVVDAPPTVDIPPADGDAVILQPETRVLSAAELAGLTNLTRTNAAACDPWKPGREACDFTFSLATMPSDIQVGSVIVATASASTPDGLLVRVSKLSGNTVYATEAGLGAAIKQGSFAKTFDLLPADVRSQQLRPGVTPLLQSAGSTGIDKKFEYELKKTELVEGVTAEGKVSFKLQCGISGDIDIVPPDVDFHAGCGVSQYSKLDVKASAAKTYNKQVEIAKVNLEAKVIMVGPVPVVLVPQVRVFVDLNGTLSAKATFSATEDFSLGAGIHYDDEHDPDYWTEEGYKAEADYALDFGGKLEAKASVSFSEGILLYGLAGPFLTETGYGRVVVDIKTTGWQMCLYAGGALSVSLDADLEVKRLVWGPKEIFSKEVELWCKDPPNQAPVVTITSPAEGASLFKGSAATFKASLFDPGEGDGGTLTWTSDQEGALGTSTSTTSLSKVLTTLGQHVITASITDSGGLTGSASVTVNVIPAAPTITLSATDVNDNVLSSPIAATVGDRLYLAAEVIKPSNGVTLPSCPNDLSWDAPGLTLAAGGDACHKILDLTVPGSFQVSASAPDSEGAPVSSSLSIDVAAAPVNVEPKFSKLTATDLGTGNSYENSVIVHAHDALRFDIAYLNYAAAQREVTYSWSYDFVYGGNTPLSGVDSAGGSSLIWNVPGTPTEVDGNPAYTVKVEVHDALTNEILASRSIALELPIIVE